MNLEEGFAIRPPAGWQLKPPPAGEMKALFVGPPKDGASPLLAVWVDTGPGNVTDFINQLKIYYERTRQNNEIIRANIHYVNNQPERVFVEWAHTNQNVRTKVLELVLASGGRKFTAECSAPASSFDEYQRLFESALATFRLIPPSGEKQIAAFQMRPDGSYYNTRHNFSIMPPKGWKANHSGIFGVVAFIGPFPSKTGVPAITVEFQPVSKPLAEHVEILKQVLYQRLAGYKLLSEQPMTINGHPAYELDFTFNGRVGTALHGMRNMKVVVEAGEKKYTVTCGCGADVYAQYEQIFADTAKSLKIESGTQASPEPSRAEPRK
jgi:hypothetical protein